MNPSHSTPVDGPASDSEVVRVLDAYLSGIEAGKPADPDKLLADHPALADELRAYLQVMNLAGRLVADPHARPEVRAARPLTNGSSLRAGSSLLTTLDLSPGGAPHIQLRDLLDDHEPLVMPQSAEMPDQDGEGLGRYQLLGEIARGGMGAILKGRDVDLGRDLAIKVLLESQRGNPEVVRRFVEEAQIGGQLQHPGVVPVYELGTFPEPDRRPYFAMKLVKGQTLAALLHDRTGPAQDLPRFLSIFEQICQTVAYAHARGVIHRDLKPSNVMVGSFGEVQVMDWGLAKVLPQGGIADEAAAQPVPESAIVTARSGPAGSGSESQAGSVLGTPSYMAPEQARGEVGRIDERADVFGLGAILCEILTGRPPFWGSTREEIRARAARGDLADALGRLDASGVEGDLINLDRDCLAADPERRPRSAGEVARRLTTYLAGVQERLKTAELARVEAQARAEEALVTAVAAEARARAERRARRLTAGLAASVLITASVVGGGWTYLAQQREARMVATTRVVTDALAEAQRFRGQAQLAAIGDLTKWSNALGAARRARDLLAEGQADAALQRWVLTALADLEREQAAAEKQGAEVERDRKLLGELETIRGKLSEHWNAKQAHAEYAAAFRTFGIDLDQLDPKEAGRRIAQRSAPVELASYLDDWALRRRKARGTKDEASWRRLLAAAQIADPNPWRVALRDQIGRDDRQALRTLAADQKTLEAQPAQSLVLFASALRDQGDRDRAEQVLRRAWRLAPGDFWVNFELGDNQGVADGRFDRPEQAIRFYSACVAIRPRSSAAYNCLGTVLSGQGKFEEAISEYRTALLLKPDSVDTHTNLGIALFEQGNIDEAIGQYRESLRLSPDCAAAHCELGIAFRRKGLYAEALAAFRRGHELGSKDPDWPYPTAQSVRETEQVVELDKKLPAILSGHAKPSDATESLALAKLCHDKSLHGAAARFWSEAFRAQPKLADDLMVFNRYNAACDAALAGSGQGKDDPPLDEATKSRWRKQALEWLKAELAAWAKFLKSGTPHPLPSLSELLRRWKADPDLSGLRDQAALAKLPEDEQKACRALWAEVDALLAKTGQ
jgi:eukaryotic-like serine/threonine-protein kinase